MINVLIVCMGNICRSPMAQGVCESALARAGLEHAVLVDSAGTHAYHVGNAPDPRGIEAAARRGFDITGQRARHVVDDDFARFDLVLAMDGDNVAELRARCPAALVGRIRLLLDFAPEAGSREVPDPYYGGDAGFEHVLNLLESAMPGLIAELDRRVREERGG